jgi:ubiquinone/menaquinone biosynthesis C-methylase UbiE
LHVREYYDRRAPEYDDCYLGRGQFADEEWRGFRDELFEATRVLATLSPARILDVACGTGFLSRYLRGKVVGLDQSEAMLRIARERVPTATLLHGDAFSLPFADKSFERVVTANFYGHLHEDERRAFLAQAHRVADELVVVDAAWRDGVDSREVQERILADGSRWQVFKRYFTPDELSAELGGGRTLLAGSWFVIVQTQ